jgi:NAD(P)-dependent dehydrogenase (short-subunit alcohol dehydrogenase family)
MREIAFITGASSGIGSATAVALAERGVDSIVTFNSHEDRVRDVIEAVRQERSKAVPLRLDVGESAGFGAFRKAVIAALDSKGRPLPPTISSTTRASCRWRFSRTRPKSSLTPTCMCCSRVHTC